MGEEYQVAEERVDWVLGKGYRGISGIQDIAKPAGLLHMDWTGKALELCGSEQSISDARLLLDHHVEYYDIYQEMERQKEEIERSFEALDEAAVAAGLRPKIWTSQPRSGDVMAPENDGPAPKGKSSRNVGRGRGRDSRREGKGRDDWHAR